MTTQLPTMRALQTFLSSYSHDFFELQQLNTEYDQAKFPSRTIELIPPSSPGSLEAFRFFSFHPCVQNKRTQGVRARHDAELPPFIYIVRHPGRPFILDVEQLA